MWRFEVQDISENDFRLLRALIQLKVAEAHLVVKSQRPWPREIYVHARQARAAVPRDAIN